MTVAQDPALQTYVQEAGLTAQKDLDVLQAAKGQMAVQSVHSIIASTVPGAAMATNAAAAAEAQLNEVQAADRVQSRMLQGQQMLPLMPKLLRGQRLIELATAKKCDWAADMESAEATEKPDP